MFNQPSAEVKLVLPQQQILQVLTMENAKLQEALQLALDEALANCDFLSIMKEEVSKQMDKLIRDAVNSAFRDLVWDGVSDGKENPLKAQIKKIVGEQVQQNLKAFRY